MAANIFAGNQLAIVEEIAVPLDAKMGNIPRSSNNCNKLEYTIIQRHSVDALMGITNLNVCFAINLSSLSSLCTDTTDKHCCRKPVMSIEV